MICGRGNGDGDIGGETTDFKDRVKQILKRVGLGVHEATKESLYGCTFGEDVFDTRCLFLKPANWIVNEQ